MTSHNPSSFNDRRQTSDPTSPMASTARPSEDQRTTTTTSPTHSWEHSTLRNSNSTASPNIRASPAGSKLSSYIPNAFKLKTKKANPQSDLPLSTLTTPANAIHRSTHINLTHDTTTPNHTHKSKPRLTRHALPLKALTTLLTSAATLGLNLSSSITEEYLYDFHLLSTSTQFHLSWIPALQLSLPFLLAYPLAHAFNHGHGATLFRTGAAVLVASQVALAFCDTYVRVLLVRGLAQGVGMAGMLDCAVLAMVRGFAGRPLVVGWRRKMLKKGLAPSRARNEAMRNDGPFLLLVVGLGFVFAGWLGPVYFIVSYATLSLRQAPDDAILILILMLAVSLLASAIPGLLAHHLTGPLNTLLPSTFLSAVVLAVWIALDAVSLSPPALPTTTTPSPLSPSSTPQQQTQQKYTPLPLPPTATTLATLYALTTPLLPLLLATLDRFDLHSQSFGNPKTTLSKRHAVALAACGVGILFGSPICASLIGVIVVRRRGQRPDDGSDFTGAFACALAGWVVGGAFLVAARGAKVGWGVRGRV
ncbi:hypothetical protein EJ05DRAFT_538888 [Pseudovirgaria hyperparasitica]|uniref:MFS general substrate transporter n=1 Tax=Pseudovirgaria hyperparasitica TaxID=470096 RepID=A0A6A6W4F6_9PEZI|nr:uncharacterized protein EJ05DRAFT_538888 [Pseudovirgaria hyperparasitica]KAF2757752.1 hypothetical protein EJ05DRAFT_538888 [Pseudovirgaria hyperparasitica]